MTLLPVRVAPSRLGISYSTFKQWIDAGRLGAIRTAGGHHRIPKAEIDRLATNLRPQRRTQRPPLGRTGIAVLGDSNRLCGRVDEVRSHGLVAQIGMVVGGQLLTAVIPAEVLSDRRLQRGDDAGAIAGTGWRTKPRPARHEGQNAHAPRHRFRFVGRRRIGGSAIMTSVDLTIAIASSPRRSFNPRTASAVITAVRR